MWFLISCQLVTLKDENFKRKTSSGFCATEQWSNLDNTRYNKMKFRCKGSKNLVVGFK